MFDERPQRVTVNAPVRIADVGGWTDTWFGAPGTVCNVAVGPGVTAEARRVRRAAGAPRVRLVAADVDADYFVGPDEIDGWAAPAPGRHPLLEHAIAAVVEWTGVDRILEDDAGGDTGGADGGDDGRDGVDVVVGAAVPAGASLGTSASAVVAVLAALDGLLGGGRQTAADLARHGHQIESARCGREAGVQDQWAAAFGGTSLLTIDAYRRGGETPAVEHVAIEPSPRMRAAMEACWSTVVFGSHDSSAVHSEVIHSALDANGVGHANTLSSLRRMSELAVDAADALRAGDLAAWAEALRECTAAQERMHAALLGPAHRAAIDAARRLGALGWKVNGAGGAGGSLTVVLPEPAAVARFATAMGELDRGWQVLDLRCAPGVHRVESVVPTRAASVTPQR